MFTCCGVSKRKKADQTKLYKDTASFLQKFNEMETTRAMVNGFAGQLFCPAGETPEVKIDDLEKAGGAQLITDLSKGHGISTTPAMTLNSFTQQLLPKQEALKQWLEANLPSTEYMDAIREQSPRSSFGYTRFE